jgi:FMN phosphatase YigB (HAD superfamily)
MTTSSPISVSPCLTSTSNAEKKKINVDWTKMPRGGPGGRRKRAIVSAVSNCTWLALMVLSCCAPVASYSTGIVLPSLLFTFDLDDTLFPVNEVIQEANDAQLRAMQRLGYTEPTMDQCMVQTKAIRQRVTKPMTYTDLRKEAIRAELERMSKTTRTEEQAVNEKVEECFEAWLQERHAAAERHLFPETIPALKDLHSQYGTLYDLCIGGITNGKGSPLCMTNTVAEFFEFCVSGEDPDIFPHRKPHPNIYTAALNRWRTLKAIPPRHLPTVWVHVGDCLANDVGASSDVGAKAIWVAPCSEAEEQPSWSTATKEDLQVRAQMMEAARSKMSGQVTNLSQLTDVVQEILNMEGISSSASITQRTETLPKSS